MPSAEWGTAAVGYDLDAIDIELLKVLQHDNQVTASEVAQRLPLSISSASRRLAKLRQSGVIGREAATLSDEFLASRVFAVVHVQMSAHSPEVVRQLKDDLEHHPEVVSLFEVTGAWDLLLLIVERDLAAFVRFTDDYLSSNPLVHRFETSFVKKRIKATLAVPLDERDITG